MSCDHNFSFSYHILDSEDVHHNNNHTKRNKVTKIIILVICTIAILISLTFGTYKLFIRFKQEKPKFTNSTINANFTVNSTLPTTILSSQLLTSTIGKQQNLVFFYHYL